MTSKIPSLTEAEMREVDRIAVDELHLDLLQMMENAGRSLAQLALARFVPARCVVLAGTGGNGGGGLTAARHLQNRGVEARVVLATDEDQLSPAAAHQLDILRRMGVPVDPEPSSSDLIIDALIGYSLAGNPRGRTADLISWTSLEATPVLSLDIPSGLDATSGDAFVPCVTATSTLTLASEVRPPASSRARRRAVACDISIAAVVYERIGVRVPQLFASDTIIRLSPEDVDG